MDEAQKGVETMGEAQTPVDTAPVSEQEAQVINETEAGENPVKTPEVEDDQSNSLPVDQSEAAKAFQKMRQEKKLAQQRAMELEKELEAERSGVKARQTKESLFQTINAPNADVSKTVRQVLSEQQAEREFPQLSELNPDGTKNPQFDPEFAELVQAKYFHSLVNTGEADAYASAKKVAQVYFRGQEAKKEATEQIVRAKKQLTEKEQAAVSATGRSQPGLSSQQRLQELQLRSRQGDLTAIVERMKNVR